MSQTHEGSITCVNYETGSGVTMAPYRRVKYDLSNANGIVYADAADGDKWFGVTLPGPDGAGYAYLAPVSVQLKTGGHTVKVEASAAVTANAFVYPTDDGKVSDDAGTVIVGQAAGTSVASGSASVVEVQPIQTNDAPISFAATTIGTTTTGSLITTGSTWKAHATAGACAVKLLCSNTSATGDYATMRIRGRSNAAGSTEGINSSASAGQNDYGNLCAGYFAAQSDAYTQATAANIATAIHGVIDATAASVGRRWVAWIDTHATTKASGGDYMCRISHNGTIANDGCFTIYTGGRLPVLFNIEDAAGFLTDTSLSLSTQAGALAVTTPAGTRYIPLYSS